jgi:hypothetical protein
LEVALLIVLRPMKMSLPPTLLSQYDYRFPREAEQGSKGDHEVATLPSVEIEAARRLRRSAIGLAMARNEKVSASEETWNPGRTMQCDLTSSDCSICTNAIPDFEASFTVDHFEAIVSKVSAVVRCSW